MIRTSWSIKRCKKGHILCRQMSVYLLAEYFKVFFVGNTGKAEWVKREVCERETERSQRILKPSRHARKRKSEREEGSHAAAAARADPPVNTRRGAVEGGSERADSERVRNWTAKFSPYLAIAGKNAFSVKRASPIPRSGGHFRNHCF